MFNYPAAKPVIIGIRVFATDDCKERNEDEGHCNANLPGIASS